MAMPALMLELEPLVEERVARLEANVEHMRSDISDIKLDIRRLNDKIDSADHKLTDKIDGVKDSVTNLTLNVEKSFAALNVARAVDRVWWLLMSGALLGIMARAFKWI
jgi:predicted  nucleic acid-binding Zn-ribbon protein